MSKSIDLFGEDQFPTSSNHQETTGYKRLRKSPEGRAILRQSGFVVRSKSAPSGGRSERGRTGRTFATKPFICWDGEGVNDKSNKHHYIILAASTGDYLQSSDGPFPTGLGTIECFDFMLDIAARNPYSTHVIYGGNYDANKILKDLKSSEYRLRKLWDTEGVFWKNYHIDWIKGKWIEIRNVSTGQRIKLYDVISFFQTSFVNTLNAWGIQVDHLEKMEQMKKTRSEFKWEDRKKILAYCQSELDAFGKLMCAFRDNHIAAGLPAISAYYGPGAIANGLLKAHGIQRCMMSTDSELRQASLHAYAAGRIERLRYGNHNGNVRLFDINSAYPYSIARLPNLNGGWKKRRFNGRISGPKPDPVPMSLYRIRLFNHDRYASPLFYRKGLTKSRPIYFPNPKGNDYIETWIWTPEYESLLNGGFPFKVLEGHIFQGDIQSKPFAWLEDLYYIRLQRKRENHPSEKNLKLAYNSIYGKFVQQAGYSIKKQIPKWHQLEWGGYVTSDTRSRLYNAMASIDFAGVVGVETDSIIITGDRTPDIKLSDQLGDWGVKHFDGITYIQSGVYWLKSGDKWEDKYSKRRGYLPGTLNREEILNAWRLNPYGDSSINAGQDMVVRGRGREFITLGHCFRPGQSLDEWGNWREGPKKLSLWKSTKRQIDRLGNPANQLLTTTDNTQFRGWSSPYTLEWGDIEDE